MSGAANIVSIDFHDDHGRRAAVRLLGASVPAECHGLVAYHAAGCDAFMAAALSPEPEQRTVLLRAVVSGTEVIAVADWRILAGQLFLNGISVRGRYQGLGLGSRLLTDGMRLAGDLRLGALGLDVSLANVGAYALYRKLGFEEMEYSWWEDVSPQPGRAHLRILDWPNFEAHHAAYGFGDLSIRYGADQPSKVRAVGAALRVGAGADGAFIAHALSGLLAPSLVYSIRTGPPAGGPCFAAFARMELALPGAGARSLRGQRRSARSA
jgi:GNAT superfamily N-acetyltransferase